MRWFFENTPARRCVRVTRRWSLTPGDLVSLTLSDVVSLTLSAVMALALTDPAMTSVAAADDLQSVQATSFRSASAEVPGNRTESSRQRETPTVRAIRRASPAVVNLHGQKLVRGAASMNSAAGDGIRQVNGMGTGVVIDPRGYVITNYHVVEDVGEINVTLHNGRNTRADLIASDPRSDLALVKIRSAEPMETIPRGRSDDLMIGETVIAIGNAYGYVHTSTQGIISALHRDIPVNEAQQYFDLIQTSAGINPGNSGGPLLNIDGEMIGVNVAVRVNAQQIAFAIPIDQVLETVTDMIRRDNDRRSLVGLKGKSDRDGGFRITDVLDGGTARRGGLQRGDRITMVEQTPVDDELKYALSMFEASSGRPVRIEFVRDGDTYETQLAMTGSASEFADPVATAAWQVLGVALRPADDSVTRKMNARMRTNYRGGLTITKVRPGSAADQALMQPGDVLLGLHSWETATMGDLAGVLEHPDIRRGPRARFYLIRRDQTLYGDVDLAAQSDLVAGGDRAAVRR